MLNGSWSAERHCKSDNVKGLQRQLSIFQCFLLKWGHTCSLRAACSMSGLTFPSWASECFHSNWSLTNDFSFTTMASADLRPLCPFCPLWDFVPQIPNLLLSKAGVWSRNQTLWPHFLKIGWWIWPFLYTAVQNFHQDCYSLIKPQQFHFPWTCPVPWPWQDHSIRIKHHPTQFSTKNFLATCQMVLGAQL